MKFLPIKMSDIEIRNNDGVVVRYIKRPFYCKMYGIRMYVYEEGDVLALEENECNNIRKFHSVAETEFSQEDEEGEEWKSKS